MDKNIEQVALNSDVSIGNLQSSKQFTNINVGYCCKCLRVLDGNDTETVKDHDGNIFCDSSCRADFFRENRKELDSILENIK